MELETVFLYLSAAMAVGIPAVATGWAQSRIGPAAAATLAEKPELTVTVVKQGREPGQGVAYLDDGTMVVVEQASGLVGQLVPVVVTSVLQTRAGKMIFADLKSGDEEAPAEQ